MSNAAILFVLRFMYVVLSYIAKATPSKLLDSIVTHFPKTVYYLRKRAGLHKHLFKRYIVCPDCYSLYDPQIEKMTAVDSCNVKISKRCTFIRFPNHPHHSKRVACGCKLMHKVKCSGNAYAFRPKLTYCYNYSLKSSLVIFGSVVRSGEKGTFLLVH